MMDSSCSQCRFEDTQYMNTPCGGNVTQFMLLLQTLVSAKCDIADPCRRIGRDDLPDNSEFDFVIVGAGVAGPVIARRLSDNPRWSVLLIEAGPEEPTMTALPGLAFSARHSSLDWKFETEPTQPIPTACIQTGGKCTWPRGKMISGTGGMNGMMYVRGHPEIYNRWAKSGNRGWSYKEIKHYFERAENPATVEMVTDEPSTQEPTNGPINIEHFRHKPAFSDDLLEAAKELNYKATYLNGRKQTGFMRAPMMTKDGLRVTTSRAYLRPVYNRENLRVLTNAQVTKILIDRKNRSAFGVEYIDKSNKKHKVMFRKEIILSAGAIGSPHILLNSGIGPRNDLAKLGIPVYANLPVGRSLKNHVSIGVPMSIRDRPFETLTVDSIKEFLDNRTGPLASTGLTQMTALLESTYATPGVPDIQVFFDGFSSKCPKYGQQQECPDGTTNSCGNRRPITVRPTTVNTKSKGYMKLRSNNPRDPPLIYPNYFTEGRDLKILVQGVKKVLALTNTRAMKNWDLRLEREHHPWCSSFLFGTNLYWECYIRAETGPENHQCGSVKMGPQKDPDAVVNSELRVYGFLNIRVADASVFPENPNSNPVATIVMVAEKASDLITQMWT